MASTVYQSEILTTDDEHAWRNFFNMLKKLGVFLDEPHGTFLLQGCNQYYNGFYMSLNNQEYNKKPCYFKVFPSVAVNDKRPCLWSTAPDRWSLSHEGSRDITAELLNGRWSRSAFLHIAWKFVSKKQLCREFLKVEEGRERNALRNTLVSCLGHDMPDVFYWESRPGSHDITSITRY